MRSRIALKTITTEAAAFACAVTLTVGVWGGAWINSCQGQVAPPATATPDLRSSAPPSGVSRGDGLGDPAGPILLEYNDSQRGWSITLPSGWAFVSEEVIKDAQQRIDAAIPGTNVRFLCGFVLTSPSPGELIPPYVLVQYQAQPMSLLTYDDLDGLFGSETTNKGVDEAAGILPLGASNAPLTSYIDRVRNRLIMQSRLNMPFESLAASEDGQSRVQVIELTSTGFLLRHGVIQFNCYAPQQLIVATQPLFQTLIESVRILEGHAFVPYLASARLAQPAAQPWALSKFIRTMAVIGIALAALGVAVVLVLRRDRV